MFLGRHLGRIQVLNFVFLVDLLSQLLPIGLLIPQLTVVICELKLFQVVLVLLQTDLFIDCVKLCLLCESLLMILGFTNTVDELLLLGLSLSAHVLLLPQDLCHLNLRLLLGYSLLDLLFLGQVQEGVVHLRVVHVGVEEILLADLSL